jgi:ribosomal protein S18 acetylase RimI-like enzyme
MAVELSVVEIRRARPSDATSVAAVHAESWRTAYQGIIPGLELARLINLYGASWWEGAIRKGIRLLLLMLGDMVAGYAWYGHSRARSLSYDGEIYKIYLHPQYQGLGFGRRLFTAARRDLANAGMKSMLVWALSDNEPATEFYRALDGQEVARSSELFGDKVLNTVAYAWDEAPPRKHSHHSEGCPPETFSVINKDGKAVGLASHRHAPRDAEKGFEGRAKRS